MNPPAQATAPRTAKLNDVQLVPILVHEKVPPKVELRREDFLEFSPWRWEHLTGSRLYLFEQQAMTVSSHLRPELLSRLVPDGDKNALIGVYFFTLKYDEKDQGYTDTDFQSALQVAKSKSRMLGLFLTGIIGAGLKREPMVFIAPAPAWLEDDLVQHLSDLEMGRAATEDALKVVWDDGKAP